MSQHPPGQQPNQPASRPASKAPRHPGAGRSVWLRRELGDIEERITPSVVDLDRGDPMLRLVRELERMEAERRALTDALEAAERRANGSELRTRTMELRLSRNYERQLSDLRIEHVQLEATLRAQLAEREAALGAEHAAAKHALDLELARARALLRHGRGRSVRALILGLLGTLAAGLGINYYTVDATRSQGVVFLVFAALLEVAAVTTGYYRAD
jgi:hypothetical protein